MSSLQPLSQIWHAQGQLWVSPTWNVSNVAALMYLVLEQMSWQSKRIFSVMLLLESTNRSSLQRANIVEIHSDEVNMQIPVEIVMQ